ncbi:MAG: hypothetical protein WBP26_05005 [Candidatus Saccharimonadales bacterium]
MSQLSTNAETAKAIAKRFTLRATFTRNTITGLILALFLAGVGLIAGEDNLLMAFGIGLIFIPVGSLVDQAWYQYYKKRMANK